MLSRKKIIYTNIHTVRQYSCHEKFKRELDHRRFLKQVCSSSSHFSSNYFQISMNAARDLALMVERVRICQEATDVDADQDSWASTARQVSKPKFFYILTPRRGG